MDRRSKADDCNAVYVFAGRVAGTRLTDIRKAVKGAWGDDKAFRLHSLRRTLITHAFNIGIEGKRLKALVNHADEDVTENYYQSNMERRLAEFCADNLPREEPRA